MKQPFVAILFGTLSFALAADVTITEFMADNDSTRATAAGRYEDWIELSNDGEAAVDLAGWRLGTSKKKSADKGWAFPPGARIAAHSRLVVYADKLDTYVNGEYHTNFKLSKTGNDDHLWLVDAEGNVKSDFGAYPIQFEDVSYGSGRKETVLVGSTTPVTYKVGSTSYAGVGGIGFAANSSVGFECKHYTPGQTVDSVSRAESLVNSSSPIATKYFPHIAFLDNSTTCSFSTSLYSPLPAWTTTGSDHNNFILVATSMVNIPSAGIWTFCVGSDDGFVLTISGHGKTYSIDAGSRSYALSFLQCNIPEAGNYSVRLLYYEQSGGASCDFGVAQGSYSAFNANVFTLVGRSDSPVQHAGQLARYIDTNISSAMLNRALQTTATWQFVRTAAPVEGDTATLALRYADGCTVSLNGHALGAYNMNGTSPSSRRAAEAALTPTLVNVPVDYFVEGTNSLVIVGYNNSYSDGDFLIAPELTYHDAALQYGYYRTPTPGNANAGTLYNGPTPSVRVSEPRGYKTAAFDVTLSCPDQPNATIFYTLDGSLPSQTHGTRYTGPIHVAKTTVLRAIVPDDRSILARTESYSWLFMGDIVNQSSAVPAGWPASGSVNGHTMKYGLSSSILSSDRARFVNGMTNAPHVATLSLVCDLKDLFGSGTGIYVYPGNQGRGWERPVSIECIDPVNGTNNEFQINAGLRIRGAASRSTGNPKHSFHVFFREEYGTASKLDFPLFGDEGARSFKKVDLRSEQNHAWHSTNERANTLVRDVFSRDSQRDMGEIAYGRSRYYHLYINGQYWGIYQTEERPEENFGESYFGTDKASWDVIKKNHDRALEYTNGSLDAYNQLFNLAVSQGFAGTYSNNYWKVQGLNADGSTNATYRPLLNIDNLINYVLITHFTADGDSPVSAWSDFSNNLNMLYDQTGANRGFFWLHHDSEHSMGATNGKVDINDGTYGYPANIFDWGTARDHSNFTRSENMNPLGLHDKLMSHPLYKRRFADALQRTFFNNGPLTVANAKARVQARMDEIDSAIVGEAARWGNGATRTDWLNACADVMTFIEKRHPVLMQQYRAKGWLPSVSAPTCSPENGTAAPLGSPLRLAAASTFYYTTDGSDPVDEAGRISPAAVQVVSSAVVPSPRTLFATRSSWAYYDWGTVPPVDGAGRAWNRPDYVQPSSWGTGPGILGVVGNNGTAVGTATHRYIDHATSGTQVTTTYFRRTFDLSAAEAAATSLAMNMLFDDGYVLYINGVEVDRLCMNAGTVTYSTWANTTIGTSGTYTQNSYATRLLTIPEGLLRAGSNTIAVEVHQIHATSTDLYWDCSLATTDASFSTFATCEATLALRGDGLTVKARSLNNGTWSALSEFSFTSTPPHEDLSGLRIAEIMHAPDKAANIAPYDEDAFSWVELVNHGTNTVNLFGCSLVGEKFEIGFGDLEVAPGERFVVTGSATAFALAHTNATCCVLEWAEGGEIKRKGDTIVLADPAGGTLAAVTFANTWFDGATYNTGCSLVVRDLAADQTTEAFSTPAAWKVGCARGGTPGRAEWPRILSITRNDDFSVSFTATELDSPWTLYYSTNLSAEAVWIKFSANRCKVVDGVLTAKPLKIGESKVLYTSPQVFFRLTP